MQFYPVTLLFVLHSSLPGVKVTFMYITYWYNKGNFDILCSRVNIRIIKNRDVYFSVGYTEMRAFPANALPLLVMLEKNKTIKEV